MSSQTVFKLVVAGSPAKAFTVAEKISLVVEVGGGLVSGLLNGEIVQAGLTDEVDCEWYLDPRLAGRARRRQINAQRDRQLEEFAAILVMETCQTTRALPWLRRKPKG